MTPVCLRKIIAVLMGVFLGSAPLRAVQVYGTSGTSSTYTTAPSDDFGFANVAQVFDSKDGFYTSGVYLGNGWILSAYHEVRSDDSGTGGFLFGAVLLDGTAYNVNAATATRITDPVTKNPVDLALYQLATVPTDPNLKTLTVSLTTPATNSSLILMGNGVNRAATLTNWNAAWTEIGGAGTYSGYYYGSGQSLRWGNGSLAGTLSADDGFGITTFLYSLFKKTDGSAMAATGDSGGGVFYKRNTAWELCGIMNTVGGLSGQPASTSVVGDGVYAANLSTYHSQINSVAGVPTITTLLGSQTAIWGTSVTLSVNATGFGTLSYQWYKNNVAITGGTQSSYTISSAVTADAANYTVKVTDPYGATTSSIYVLTVTPPTHLDLWRQTYFPGSTATSGSGADSATPLYDGVSNLMKFATGMDPTQPGLRPGTIDVSGTDLLFTYTPSAGAVADGFTFTVEYSDTLGIGSWFSDIVDQGIIGSGGAPVTATLPQGSGPRRFLRLKINKP